MANEEPSRTVMIQMGHAVRWSHLWCLALIPIMGVSVCIADVTEHSSSTVVLLIPLFTLILGFAGFIAVGMAIEAKSKWYFRVVFTIRWTEPKGAWGALRRLECGKTGIAAWLWRDVRVGLIASGIWLLLWLPQWLLSWVEPSVRALSLPWAVTVILLFGIGMAALFHLFRYLDAVTSPRTMGLGREWMGHLQGRPRRTLWPYEQIADVRFESVQVHEKQYRFMIVTPHKGHEVAFGLSDEVDVCEIASFLADKGVEVVEKT